MARCLGEAAVARQYRQRAGESPKLAPTRVPGGVDVRGLTARHWSLLMVLATHGPLHTGQVVTLMFGSRPAAVRYLTALVRADLAWRFVYDNDSSHLAYYEVSTDGVAALKSRLQATGRPTPLGLGRPARGQLDASAFLVALTRTSRENGSGHLYRWRRATDTAMWLRDHGVGPVDVVGQGTWIEDGATVSFLLHVDCQPWKATNVSASMNLDGYRRANGVPATVILVVCATTERQRCLHTELTADPLPARVATTTPDRLHEHGPAGPAWTVDATRPTVRLIDLARS
ncbi:hypothetical protein [Virgisporangium aurantiacum]|uniref:Replication-relaxation n=1 Tax=Virgisporangium aurantiacum TaxID=175570 RepID=A0A8J3Z1B0_9ACTN|nr:hypothetical protein [Virgisporangium aurantiacum]GIJ54453.1 hypothetical protein Vau01_019690 [Virgisporangium aurantiacum]